MLINAQSAGNFKNEMKPYEVHVQKTENISDVIVTASCIDWQNSSWESFVVVCSTNETTTVLMFFKFLLRSINYLNHLYLGTRQTNHLCLHKLQIFCLFCLVQLFHFILGTQIYISSKAVIWNQFIYLPLQLSLFTLIYYFLPWVA